MTDEAPQRCAAGARSRVRSETVLGRRSLILTFFSRPSELPCCERGAAVCRASSSRCNREMRNTSRIDCLVFGMDAPRWDPTSLFSFDKGQTIEIYYGFKDSHSRGGGARRWRVVAVSRSASTALFWLLPAPLLLPLLAGRWRAALAFAFASASAFGKPSDAVSGSVGGLARQLGGGCDIFAQEHARSHAQAHRE